MDLSCSVNSDVFTARLNLIESLWRYGPSKLVIVRVDFGIRVDHQSAISAFEIIDDFERLRANRRSKPRIFEHNIGMIWSLEFTPDKSYHYHALFVFNGHEIQNDVYYADQIGEYWCNQITKGKGTYWNCNRQAVNYPVNGLGMICHNDWSKRQALLTHVVPYLAKPDHLIRAAIQNDAIALGMSHWAHKVRTYGASHPLTGRQSPAGRPRIGGMPSVPQLVYATPDTQVDWSVPGSAFSELVEEIIF